jgi:hypothetical protein
MYPIRWFRMLPILIALFLFGGIGQVRAQGSPASVPRHHVEIEDPTTDFLNRSLAELGEHTQQFNDRVTAINALRPLDLQNLDSTKIEHTISEVLRFTEYLKDFLLTTDSLHLRLTDSLFILRNADPSPDVQRSLAAFETSYKTDQHAFKTYVEVLRGVYQNVLETLLFVKSTQYRIGPNGLQFFAASDIKHYDESMGRIDRMSKDLKKASEASRKATDQANKQLLALNALHAQRGRHPSKRAATKSTTD